MPELPEVESIRRKLALILPGQQIEQIEVYRDKSFLEFPELGEQLRGRRITAVERRAKILQLVLDGEHDLLVHLKMTGQLIFVGADGQRSGGGHPTADWVTELPTKHTRVVFYLAGGARLFFNDQRVFGWIRAPHKTLVQREFVNYGPDINDPTLTAEYLFQLAQQRSIPIKQFIMDNAVVCGVGNIYASESLFTLGLQPHTPAKEVAWEQMRALLQIMQTIITRAIELGGTTFDGKYVGVDGFAGGFQHELRVYGREGQPCLQCGTAIVKTKISGRGTFHCPRCQQTMLLAKS